MHPIFHQARKMTALSIRNDFQLMFLDGFFVDNLIQNCLGIGKKRIIYMDVHIIKDLGRSCSKITWELKYLCGQSHKMTSNKGQEVGIT